MEYENTRCYYYSYRWIQKGVYHMSRLRFGIKESVYEGRYCYKGDSYRRQFPGTVDGLFKARMFYYAGRRGLLGYKGSKL